MKVLRALVFFLLALLVFIGFVYPLSVIPKRYEAKALEMANERAAKGSLAVQDSYIEESVHDAVVSNIDNIYFTCFCVASAVAFIVYLLTIRPPHDCGGINWFNPIGLIFTVGLTFLTLLVLKLFLGASSASSTGHFLTFVEQLTDNYTYSSRTLFLIVIIPTVLELLFRGVIFSYFEKIHFIPAVVLSSLLYAVSAYLIVNSFTGWKYGFSDTGMIAAYIAFLIGAVESIIVSQLKSVIPAVISHVLLAYLPVRLPELFNNTTVSPAMALIFLIAALGVFVYLFTFLSKKTFVLDPAFPFVKHRKWLDGWLERSSIFHSKKVEKKVDEQVERGVEAVKRAEKKLVSKNAFSKKNR